VNVDHLAKTGVERESTVACTSAVSIL